MIPEANEQISDAQTEATNVCGLFFKTVEKFIEVEDWGYSF